MVGGSSPRSAPASAVPDGTRRFVRARSPTVETVGYCRVSLPGQRAVAFAGKAHLGSPDAVGFSAECQNTSPDRRHAKSSKRSGLALPTRVFWHAGEAELRAAAVLSDGHDRLSPGESRHWTAWKGRPTRSPLAPAECGTESIAVHPNKSISGSPVDIGLVNPSLPSRVSSGTPREWKIVAPRSCGRTGRSLT